MSIKIKWNEYHEIIYSISNEIKKLQEQGLDLHLVSIYRGSLLLGQHLSNLNNLPLSIIKFQRVDSNDKVVNLIHSNNIKKNSTLIILDDIFDTGETINKVHNYFKEYKTITYTLCYNNIIHKQLKNNIYSYIKTNNKWVTFPWEY